MKTWQVYLLAILLLSVPLLSACDLLGIGKSKKQERYEQQIEAIQKQQEAAQKQQEEYNRQMQEALNKWSQEYNEWQKQQIEQQMGITSDNQS